MKFEDNYELNFINNFIFSSNMKKKEDDKKTALKLINQYFIYKISKLFYYRYADSYKRVEEENRILKNELINYKTNLKINKDIIEGFFSNLNNNDKSLLIVKKIREESEITYKKYEQLKKENQDFKEKINYYENVLNESIFKQIDNIDTLKNKIFILENALIKKDNLILNLNSRLNRFMQQDDYPENLVREVYVRKFIFIKKPLFLIYLYKF